MARKLFLTSSFKEVFALLPEFAGELHQKKVAFLPTASKVENVQFCVRAGKKALEKLGATVDVLDLGAIDENEMKARIAGSDIIYVTGGNTFFLLQEMKRTGADIAIKQAIDSGKIYVGESAGAMITAPDIEYVTAMDSIKKAPHLSSYEALGLVDFYIVPHYLNIPFKRVTRNMVERYAGRLDLRPISNQEVVFVKEDEVTLIKAKRKMFWKKDCSKGEQEI